MIYVDFNSVSSDILFCSVGSEIKNIHFNNLLQAKVKCCSIKFGDCVNLGMIACLEFIQFFLKKPSYGKLRLNPKYKILL